MIVILFFLMEWEVGGCERETATFMASGDELLSAGGAGVGIYRTPSMFWWSVCWRKLGGVLRHLTFRGRFSSVGRRWVRSIGLLRYDVWLLSAEGGEDWGLEVSFLGSPADGEGFF